MGQRARQQSVSVGSVFLWILAGAIVSGGFGWLLATAVGATPAVGGAAGIAAGGGLGAALRLLVYPSAQRRRETVTVEMGDGEAGAEPLDLFEAHPDPLCYYTGGETPTVRAVNPAYEETFGISASTIEEADLDGALMTTETGPFVEAATDGATYETTVVCETASGEKQYLVRVIPIAGAADSRGYVLYTPHEN